MTAFDDWVARNTGAFRDVDGAYGAQCWDLFAAYCTDLYGAGPGQANTASSGPWAGYAGSLYASYPVTPWQGAAFERIPAGSPARKGDVAIWASDAGHPVTHVAVVIQDAAAGQGIRVIAQNAGPAQNARIMWETPASYGYLRPKNQQPIQGDIDMPAKTDPINLPNGQAVTVEYALQAILTNQSALKKDLAAMGKRLGPVDGYSFDYLPAILNNLNALFGLVGKSDGQPLTDEQISRLADSLRTNLGASVAGELAKRLND